MAKYAAQMATAIPTKVADQYGEIRLVSYAEEHCMIRRPGRSVCVVHLREWLEMAEREAIENQLAKGPSLK